MNTRLILLLTALVLVAAMACDSDKPVNETVNVPVNWSGLPEPYHTPSATNRPRVVERPSEATLQLPEGFKIEEYLSGDFQRPRFMLLGPSDELVFTDSGSRNELDGSVYVHHDGQLKKIVEGLDRPYGLAFHEDWLYVAECTSVKRYVYDSSSMTAGMGKRSYPTRTLTLVTGHDPCYSTRIIQSCMSLLGRVQTSIWVRTHYELPCIATTRMGQGMKQSQLAYGT